MVLGTLWCPLAETRNIAEDIRRIKTKYGLARTFEIKWTKVSPAKVDFYSNLIDYFFTNKYLHFRAVVIPDKSVLTHQDFHQTHDDWYYKMYFTLLKEILSPNCKYHIYLDIKDTRSAEKVRKLKQVLHNYFQKEIIENIQNIHSHEIEQVQLADLLIGAISYVNRSLFQSSAKNTLVEQVKKLSGRLLTSTTPQQETKFNLLVWQSNKKD